MHHGDVHKRFTVSQAVSYLGFHDDILLANFVPKDQAMHKKILQEYPKGLKDIRLKKMMGLSTLRCLIRRCQESYDFPYDFIRFSV